MAVSPSPPVSPTGLLHRLSKLQIDAPSIVDQESGEVGSQNGGRWRKTSARWNRMGSTCGSGISLCSCSTSWPLSSTAPPPCGQGSGSAPSRVSSNSGGTTRDAERPSQAPALRPGVWGLAFGVRRENGAASRFPLPASRHAALLPRPAPTAGCAACASRFLVEAAGSAAPDGRSFRRLFPAARSRLSRSVRQTPVSEPHSSRGQFVQVNAQRLLRAVSEDHAFRPFPQLIPGSVFRVWVSVPVLGNWRYPLKK